MPLVCSLGSMPRRRSGAPVSLIALVGAGVAGFAVGGGNVKQSVAVAPAAKPQPSRDEKRPGAAPAVYRSLRFDHHYHVTELGLVCTSCHIIEEGRPVAPNHGTCSACHTIDEAAPDILACLLCHVLPDRVAPSVEALQALTVDRAKPPSFEDVVYDHALAGEDDASCAHCHDQAAVSKALGHDLLPTMLAATNGFARLGGSADDCAACHEVLRADVAPSSHADAHWVYHHGLSQSAIAAGQCDLCHTVNECQACHAVTAPRSHDAVSWTRLHGKQFAETEAGACLMCHREDACRQCHATQAPTDHTNFWRVRGHGQDAAIDRARCQVCHKEDFCLACHRAAAPTASRRPFHNPRADCLQCHGAFVDANGNPFARPVRAHGPLPLDTCLKCHALP